MKSIVVTGANGFIGSAVVRELLDAGYKVYAIDKEGCNNNIPKHEAVTFIPCDLCNIRDIIEIIPKNMCCMFYHFAWAGSAGDARFDYTLQLKNALWTIEAIKVASDLGCERFICAGSIMEHETIAAVYEQYSKPGLGYIYGSGKLVAHTMCKSIAADLGIQFIWAKITNAYGVGELSPRFVNTTIRKIINKEKLVFTAATQNYDFIFITDVAKAFRLLGEKGHAFCDYTIGSGKAKSLKEFILDLVDALEYKYEVTFGDIAFTGVDLQLEMFDTTKLYEDTGFIPEISFQDGIKKTAGWLYSL